MSQKDTAKQLCVSYLVGALLVEYDYMPWAVEAAHRMYALASEHNVGPDDFTGTPLSDEISVLLHDQAYSFTVADLEPEVVEEIVAVKDAVASGDLSSSQTCPACAHSSRTLH